MFVIGALLEATYVAAIGGDYLHARLLLPCVFALTAPVAVVPLTRRCAAALLVVPWAVVAMFWLKPDQLKHGNYLAHGFEMTLPGSYGSVTVDQSGWGPGGDGPSVVPGARLLQHRALHRARCGWTTFPSSAISRCRTARSGASACPATRWARTSTCSTSWGSRTRWPPTSRRGRTASRASPGTRSRSPRRGWPRWSRGPAHAPDVRDFPDIEKPLTPATTGLAFQRQVAWARAALRCGGLARVLAAADAPLTPRRFLSNALHSFANTRTRVPPNPEAAYHRFCGAGTPPEVRALDR